MQAPSKPIARPLTLDEKIVNSKEAVAYEVRRIKICGYIFMMFGLICMLTGVNEVFGARLKAAFIFQEHQIPWGNQNFTNFTMANVTSASMDRVEVELYDHIRNMSLLTVVVSFFLFMIGRSALRTTSKQKSRVSQRMFRRSFIFFLCFLVFYVFTRKQSRSFTSVFEKLKEGDENQIVDANMTSNFTEESKRNLRMFEVHSMSEKDFDDIFKQHNIPDDVQQMMADMKRSNE